MKKIFRIIQRIIFSFFALYGFNMIGVYFNFLLPINIFSLSFVFLFDIAGFIVLILFKIIM